MIQVQINKRYDLEDRTFVFAQQVRAFVPVLAKSIASFEDVKQLVRSSGSVGANYIEANEALSKKDFLMRVKISRKEAKESVYWLRLLEIPDANLQQERDRLLAEATELVKIFSAIIKKSL